MQIFQDLNLSLLKQKNFILYQTVINYTPNYIGEILPTKTLPTLRFHHPGLKHPYVCSPDDPVAEIYHQMPLLQNKSNLNQTICIFTGMGLGYRQLIALEKRQDIFRIMILEPSFDMFCLALKYVDLRPLFQSEKVFIFAGNIDWKEFDDIINRKKIETDFRLIDSDSLFDWDPERYNEVKNRVHACAVRAISETGILSMHGDQLFKNRINNMTLFREIRSADMLKGAFKDKPAVIVSAGPSLDQSMDQLKEAAGRCVMIAVDSAVVPLLRNGITPDFVTTLDHRDLNSEKLSPDLVQSASFSLVGNISSSFLTARRLPLKHLFFSFQDNDTQKWMMDALNVKHLMPAVGTVASLSLSLAQMIEADPVIFVGYDFALTSTQTDHVEGSVFTHGWHTRENTLSVKGIHGGQVKTLSFLLGFKSNLEQILKRHPRDYINATASGAYIEGTAVKDLKSVTSRYLSEKLCVEDMIKAALQKKAPIKSALFIAAAQKQISAAQKTLNQVESTIHQQDKIKNYLQGQKNLSREITTFSQFPPAIQKINEKMHYLYTRVKPFMPVEEMAAQKIFEARRVQETEEPGSYIEAFAKEVKIIGLEMAGHSHGITIFIKSVKALASFLGKEDRLIKHLQKTDFEQKEYLELAELYLNNMDAVKAGNALLQCLNQYPDSSRALMLMGLAQAQMLNMDSAIQYWEKSVQKNPDLADEINHRRRGLAEYWMDRGKAEPLIFEKCLRRAFKIWKDKEFIQEMKETGWERSAGLIQKYIDTTTDIVSAESLLSLWEPVRESTPLWYYLMAKVLYKKEDIQKALSMMETALLKSPQNASWMAFCARLMMETDRFDEGIALLETAVKQDPSQAVLWEELGDTFFSLNDFANAVIAYEKCFIALPDKIDVLRKYGDCYYKLGEFEAAKTAYQVVLQKDPSNEPAKEKLKQLG